MSFSFYVRGATKAATKAGVADKLAAVATNPAHEYTRAQAQAVADAFIDLLPDAPDRDIVVSLNGAVGWSGTWGQGHQVGSVSVRIEATLTNRQG